MAERHITESEKALLASGVEIIEDEKVSPGWYRTKRYKLRDPYPSILFYSDRPVFVAGVTRWFAGQVKAGVLVKVTGPL